MPRPFDVREEEHCRVCRRTVPGRDLDARGWCGTCRADLARRVRLGQHAAGALVTAPFAVWIAIEGTGGTLPAYAWLIPLAAAWYLGMRIGREVLRGALASRRMREAGGEGEG